MEGGSFERLLSPLTVGRRTLRNRVLVTGHTTCYVDADSLPDDRDVAYFGARAAGGAAMLCTGTNVVHPSSPTPYGVYAIYDERIVERHAAIASAVHEHGGLMLVQLGHLAQRNYDEPIPIWAPSPIAHHSGGPIPHEMTVAEIKEVIAAFGDATDRARRAGMDGVEVGLGHGQLINLFLSPLTNARTDEYGGSFERRLRFAIEAIAASRDAAGPDLIVGARVNGEDGVPGGSSADEWLAISTAVAADGRVDYLNVSLDFNESLVPGMHVPHGVWLRHAARLRRQVELPVFAAGRIVDPEQAELALADGSVDAVGMTRAHIADPDLVAKLRDDRRDRIRPCIGCGHMCIGNVHRGQPISCVYNPVTGAERRRGPLVSGRAGRPLRVAVVGGGPAGLEAARVSAARGHEVTLLERSAELGGAARLAAAVPGREEFARLVGWYRLELELADVDVRTDVDADAGAIADLEPDAVVIASGGRPARPPWAGELERVIAFRDALTAERPPSGRVLVVDHDHHGQALMAAIWAAEAGADVAVVSERLAVAGGVERPTLHDLYGAAFAAGTELLPMRRVEAVEVDADGALDVTLVGTFSGAVERYAADWVVTTTAAPDERLAQSLPAGLRAVVVGDAAAPRQIGPAVHEAFDAAVALAP